MTIYIPYFDRGWHIQQADANKARKIGNYWNYCGWIYGQNAYTTEDGAQAYINKNYSTAHATEYCPV